MANYTKNTNFTALRLGASDPAVFDAEFNEIATTMATKVETDTAAAQTLLGALLVPTGATGAQVPQRQEVDAAIAALIPSGTKMVFYQAVAPVGWTQDTSVNDAALRVVSGAGGGTGGVNGFSVGTASVTGAHTLSISEIPSHNHSYTLAYDSSVSSASTNTGTAIKQTLYSGTNTGSTGGGGSHTHPLTSWKPKYADTIICTKD